MTFKFAEDAGAYIDYLRKELRSADAENARLREALKIVAAGVDTFAITPSGFPDIIVEGSSRFAHERDVLPLLDAARTALDPDGQKERRAQALAELAEMDSVLLDFDTENKP